MNKRINTTKSKQISQNQNLQFFNNNANNNTSTIQVVSNTSSHNENGNANGNNTNSSANIQNNSSNSQKLKNQQNSPNTMNLTGSKAAISVAATSNMQQNLESQQLNQVANHNISIDFANHENVARKTERLAESGSDDSVNHNSATNLTEKPTCLSGGQSTISDKSETNQSLLTQSTDNNSNTSNNSYESNYNTMNSSTYPESEAVNLENLNLEQIKNIKSSHLEEKQKFLSAVATFTRSAGEFYKLFQNFSFNSDLSSTEKAAIEYKKAVGGIGTPPGENWGLVVA